MGALTIILAAAALLMVVRGEQGAGATHFGSARWLNDTAPTDTAADRRVDLATDGAGTWIAVWDSRAGAYGNDYDLLVSRSLDDGHTWSAAAPLNTDAGTDVGSDLLPNISSDGGDAWLTVWAAEGHASTGADRDIYAARSADGGVSWTAPTLVNTNAWSDSGFDTNPQTATDLAGHVLVVWDSTDTLGGTIGDDTDILVSRSNDGGVTWSAVSALNSDATTDLQRDLSPDVQTDGAGSWVAAWETLNQLGPGEGPDNDIVVARSTDNGATWTPVAPIHPDMFTDTYQDHLVQMEVDDSGAWVGVWNAKSPDDAIANRDIHTSRSYDNGATWTAPANVRTDAATDTIEEYSAQIATDGRGNWVTVWDGQDPVNDPGLLDFDTYVALSTDGAVSWKPATYLSTTGGSDSGGDARAHIATDERGNWVMAWDSDDTLGGQVGPDREIFYVNCLPFDLDGDGVNRCSDADDDGDLVGDLAEGSCGSDGMDGNKRPERLDGTFASTDDNGDGQADEALPSGAGSPDCDGDGYSGAAETNVFGSPGADQDPCGTGGWPADIVAGGVPSSTNRVNILDITSFIAPTRRLGTSPDDNGFSLRWDLFPGAGLFTKVVNIQDLTSLIVVRPPMLGYAPAINGPVCPWPP